MEEENTGLQNIWICPKCLDQNQKSSLICNCGLMINNDDLSEYSATITAEELYKVIDNYSFIAADRKVLTLSYYLVNRFPSSKEAQNIKQKIDTISQKATDEYHTLLDGCVEKKEVTCGKCGTVSVYKTKTQQCTTCGDWLYQYYAAAKEGLIVKESTSSSYDPSSIRCPNCDNTQIVAQKQGFGLGKAVVGGLLTGGVGLLGGFIRSRKIYVTCLKCGHRFTPGK